MPYNMFHYDIGAGFDYAAGITVQSGYTAGSMSIVLASTPGAKFVAGKCFVISELQDSNKWGLDSGGYQIGNYYRDGLTDALYGLPMQRIFNYVSRITSVVGNTVNFDTPIPLNFNAENTVMAFPREIVTDANTLYEFGIEELTFYNTGQPVQMWMTDRFFMKDVEFDHCDYGDWGLAHFHGCFQTHLERLYIHDVPSWPITGEGVAIGVYDGCSNGLFKDIISNKTAMQFYNTGCSGNAFLYNYATNCSRTPGTWTVAGYAYHRGHSFMNLLEGNIWPGYHPDGYHGSSSHDVLFRNNLNGQCPALSTQPPGEQWLLNLDRFSYYMSLVGNVLGDASITFHEYEAVPAPDNGPGHFQPVVYRLGYPDGSGGNPYIASVPCSLYTGTYPDPTVLNTILRHGNYDYYNDSQYGWADADHAIDNSLFYDSKPSWFGSLAWPPIDPVGPAVNSTPAKWRWEQYTNVSGPWYNDLSILFTDSTGEVTGWAQTFLAKLKVSASETARLYAEYPHVRVVAGTSATYTILAEAYNNFTANITLDATGLPTNATDSYGTNPMAYNGSCVATIATTGVAAGTYSITFTGTAVGGEVGSVRVILEVVAVDDCSPKVPIRRIRVKQGDNAVFTVQADPTAGYTGTMDLSASGVPTGASGVFADSNIAYNESTTYTVDSGTAAVGEHEIVITGEGPV
jgi:hypothetical protein